MSGEPKLYYRPDDDALQLAQVIAERDALAARCAKLEAAIRQHNDALQAACDAHGMRCDPYISRGRCCPDCPRYYVLAPEEQA